MSSRGLAGGPDGFSFAPEGALIHEGEQVAVVADLHLGYEWARGRQGDQIPAHSLREVLARLDRLLARAEIGTLIVAGDLVESARPCARTSTDVAEFRRWLAGRSIELVALPGNHDPRPSKGTGRHLELAGWTIAHGDRPIEADRTITGHEHPSLQFGPIRTRCFLVSSNAIVLPAFSDNAAGLNVASDPVPGVWRGRGFRCLAASTDELLDFGPIDTLPARFSDRCHSR